MSNSNLKLIIFTIAIAFVAYIVKVAFPFIKEYNDLHDKNLNRSEFRKQLKILNHKYSKKTTPAIIIFISAFLIFGYIVGGSCC